MIEKAISKKQIENDNIHSAAQNCINNSFMYEIKRNRILTKIHIDAIWTDKETAHYISNFNLINLRENLKIDYKSITIKIDHKKWTNWQNIKWK